MPSADAATEKFDAIAVELYALPPEQFTAERNARAAAERDLTARLKALRKPTVAAWAVNLLAREGQLGDALELAAALREAQDDLDAAELSRLSRQRRALVSALATQAVDLARERGVAGQAAAREDVQKTVNAAVMDAAAAAAVMTDAVHPAARGLRGSILIDVVGRTSGGALPGACPTRRTKPRRARRAPRAAKAAERAAREAEDVPAGEATRELRRDRGEARGRRGSAPTLLTERIDGLAPDLERLEAEGREGKAEPRLDAGGGSRARAAVKPGFFARSALD